MSPSSVTYPIGTKWISLAYETSRNLLTYRSWNFHWPILGHEWIAKVSHSILWLERRRRVHVGHCLLVSTLIKTRVVGQATSPTFNSLILLCQVTLAVSHSTSHWALKWVLPVFAIAHIARWPNTSSVRALIGTIKASSRLVEAAFGPRWTGVT